MTKVRCFVLMGGMWGFDGSAFSRGMVSLSKRINALHDVVSTYHYWSNYQFVENLIAELPDALKTAVIGYSGGGSRASWMWHKIDLLVGYDPSPASEIRNVGNFKRVLCYRNRMPTYLLGFKLGCGQYEGKNVEETIISQHHLAVQFNEQLHQKTLSAIEQLNHYYPQ